MHKGPAGDAELRNLKIALTVVGACGIALVFLPFAYDVVPFTDVLLEPEDGALWWIALPAILLPLPITAGHALWLAGRLPAWGNPAAWVLWGLAAACTIMGLVSEYADFPGAEILAAMLACYAGGAWFARIARPALPGGLIAMQSAYLASIGIFVGEFIDEGDIGAWLAGITIVVYLLQFALAVRPRWGWLALAWLPPVALLVLAATFDG